MQVLVATLNIQLVREGSLQRSANRISDVEEEPQPSGVCAWASLIPLDRAAAPQSLPLPSPPPPPPPQPPRPKESLRRGELI